MSAPALTASCACGCAELAATGAPIVCSVCYCRDCQQGARQIEALGASGDVCLAITTSGNSQNVIKAIERARACGMKVIGLLGRDGGRAAELCDLALVVPSHDTQRIQ